MSGRRRLSGSQVPVSRELREFGAGTLEIFTLGGLRIRRGGDDQTRRVGARHQALLVFLVQQDRPVHPAQVIALLGAGGSERLEHEALARAVQWLNSNLPGIHITLTGNSICAPSSIWCDVREVLSAAERGDTDRIRQFYKGDFLDGFRSINEPFDAWVEIERNRIRDACEHVLPFVMPPETAGLLSSQELAPTPFPPQHLPKNARSAPPKSKKPPRSKSDVDLFTDSVVVHTAKTTWARMTTPRIIAGYVQILKELAEQAAIWVAALARGIADLSRSAWGWTAPKISGLAKTTRKPRQRRSPPTKHAPKSQPHAHRHTTPRRRGPVVGAAMTAGPAAGAPPRIVNPSSPKAPPPAPPPRAQPPVERPRSSQRPRRLTQAPSSRTARHQPASPNAPIQSKPEPLLGSMSARLEPTLWERLRRGLRVAAFISRPRYRRFRLATLTVALAATVAFAIFVSGEELASLASDLKSGVGSVPTPSIPSVSLPEVKVNVPKVSLRLPSFIQGPVDKLDALFGDPLIQRGGRVIVADFKGSEATGTLGQTLAIALEAELSQSQYLSVLSRERALVGLNAESNSRFTLSAEQALALAGSSVSSAAAVITGDIHRDEGRYVFRLLVLDPAGTELYSVDGRATEARLLFALARSSEPLRRRLGEPREAIDRSKPPAWILSGFIPAVDAFIRARAAMHGGRYDRAIAAAAAAAKHDTAFAMAYRVLGDAYVFAGRRARAQAPFENAWRFRNRLTERERMRLEADRAALSGRNKDAILAYDRLFMQYRDDVGALKSQAILQRKVGARGDGLGNLQVAYSIDQLDWPPLTKVARFLDYRGRLPEFEALAERSRGSD